jgi:hypothetical protein
MVASDFIPEGNATFAQSRPLTYIQSRVMNMWGFISTRLRVFIAWFSGIGSTSPLKMSFEIFTM